MIAGFSVAGFAVQNATARLFGSGILRPVQLHGRIGSLPAGEMRVQYFADCIPDEIIKNPILLPN